MNLNQLECNNCHKTGTIYIENPPQEKIKETKTLDDFVNQPNIVPLLYTPIIYTCKNCGYSKAK